jgi:ABC-2 type transport system permease protein
MSKALLIFRHEFLHMIKRIGFIIMTIAFPLLALLAIGVYQLISGFERPSVSEEVTIGYVDRAGGFEEYAQQDEVILVRFDTQDEATKALVNGDIKEYFIVPSDYISTGVISRYTLQRQLEVPAQTMGVIKNFLLGNLLWGKTSTEITERVKTPLNLVTTRLTKTGEAAPEQGGFGTFIIPYIFSLLLVVSIFFSSGYLLQGLGEEKENRVMEILLSSVSSRQLLTGKVLGLGAAGLVQVVVWLASAPLLLNLASSSVGGFISTMQIPTNFLVLGVIYFILGYLLFAVLSAGIGAISPTAREGQQLSTVLILVAMSPFYFVPFLSENPNHVISLVLTIFPITAPVSVMARLGFSDIAAWELAISIALLVLSIIGGLLLAAKTFRTYLLMYGKRPSLGEIIRSLRSA